MRKKTTSSQNTKPAAASGKKTWWQVSMWVLVLCAWAFVSMMAAQFVVGLAMAWILGAETLSRPVPLAICYIITDIVAVALTVLVPIGVLLKRKKKSAAAAEDDFKGILKSTRTELGLKDWPTWTDIGLAPVGFIVSLLIAAVAVAIFSQFPWFDAGQAQETGFVAYMSGADRIMSFISLVVVAPIAEEAIFRGWLYGKLREKLSDLPGWSGVALSILITSALFGLLHFQWNVGVNVFCLSVVLCALREVTGTIYAGILTHMVRNGVAFIMLYVLGIS